MSKPNASSLTPYQRAAIGWLLWRPRVIGCTVMFSEAEKPDKIDKWLILNVPHYAEVFCRALKIPVKGEKQICRVTNCGQPVENPVLGDICNRCFEEMTVGDREDALREANEHYDDENQHDEREG